ncbi:MAG: hypothetical protein H6658_08075 [Ardenticatenaceae bacterium]|nr:hypothetical protein [Ardenticatenaceae bacterium]
MFANLLHTKLTIPPLTEPLINRPTLLAQLAASRHHKLTLITAPAGYGKTTLLAHWLAHAPEQPNDLRCAWLSLDAADDNSSRFCAYLLAALQTISPTLGHSAEPLLQSSQDPPPTAIITTLLNDLHQQQNSLTLILDDYHLISDTAVHEALTLFIDQLPANTHLIVASRAQPPWPLARWRARGQLLEITTADLQFTRDDTAVFLHTTLSPHLTPHHITTLTQRTEGWVTGLKLATLAMRSTGDYDQWLANFSGQHRYIFDYLAAEVFSQQPAHIQQFLLDTAILQRLCAGLCAAVTSREKLPQAATILHTLEQANLFLVPLDEERHWYRFHHLFSDFLLRQRQQLDPDGIPDLHRRAATWYQAQGHLDDALQHLQAIQAYPDMAALLEAYAPRRWTAARMGTVRHWLRQLPDDLIQANTHLALAYISTLIDTFKLDTAVHHLRQLEQHLNLHIDDHIATDLHRTGREQVPPDVFNEIIALRGALAYFLHDTAAAQKLAPYMSQHLPANLSHRSFFSLNLGSYHAWDGAIAKSTEYLQEAIQAALAADNRYLAYLAYGQLGNYQLDWGQLHQAAHTFQQALSLATHAPISGWIYASLAQIHTEWDDLDAALTYLLAGREHSRLRENQGMLLANFLQHAQILLAQGDAAAATAVLHQLPPSNQPHINPALIAMSQALQAQAALAANEPDKAHAWAAQFTDPTAVPEQETVCQTLAQIWLSQNRTDEVLQLMERLLATAVPQHNSRLTIHWRIGQALAHTAQQQPTPAFTHLREALLLGQPGGFVRSYLAWGQPFYNLLLQLAQTYIEGDLETAVKRLLPHFHQAGFANQALPHLTPREMDIMRLVAAGLTNDDIATTLTVAKGTVKKHLDNIYSKLQVNSRTQALARAQELALL